MRRLGLIDYLFLLLDNARQPMHVAGVCLFDYPLDADDDFVWQLYQQAKASDSPQFPFNQTLHRMAFWRQISQFDHNAHCHYHKLTTGNQADWQQQINQLHQIPLNRQNPLWSLHLIDGVRDNNGKRQFFIYLKIHHALTDGVAAVRLFQGSLSSDMTQKNLPFAPWTIRPKRQKTQATPKKSLNPLKSSLSVLRALQQDCQDFWQKNERFVSSFAAPKSPLNQKITQARHIGLHTLQKSRISRLADLTGVSNNEMILAICGQAIDAYLHGQFAQNNLPNKPLIAFAPISLRQDDSSTGNQLSFLPASLGKFGDTPADRIGQIHQSLAYGKQRYAQMNFAEVIAHTAIHFGWAGINLATGIYPDKQAFNLVISNLPAKDEMQYFNGAKLVGMYPASVLFDGQALNISFCNYQDRLDFGIVACPDTLPNIDTLPALMDQALLDFEQVFLT